MKRTTYFLVTLPIIILLMLSCASNKISYITSVDYNKEKDITTYMIFPFGSVNIEGEWKETSYNSSSKQQFFMNKDSVSISIAFSPTNKFEFNKNGSLKGFDFTKSFHEWDSEYLSNTYNLETMIIEEDSVNNYIVWTIYGNINNDPIQHYFLFGESNDIAKNYSIQRRKHWNEAQVICFLKDLYINN